VLLYCQTVVGVGMEYYVVDEGLKTLQDSNELGWVIIMHGAILE